MGEVSCQLVTREGLTRIVYRLRERDRREIFALRWTDDPDELIHDVMQFAGSLWRLWSLDGEPVAVNGVVPVRPGVVICGAFGTDKWRAAIRPMTRWSRDFVIPVLQKSGYHRGEAYALAQNTHGRRWIEALGGQVEALLKGYGRNREDFLLYAWDLTQPLGDEKHVLRGRQDRIERAGQNSSRLH